MMKRQLTMVATMTAMLCWPALQAEEAQPKPKTAAELLEEVGNEADLDTSARYAQADAAYVQAKAYYDATRFQEAKKEIDRAIRLFPEHKLAQQLRNNIYSVLGKRGNALQQLATYANMQQNVALQEQAVRMIRMLNEGDEFFAAGDYANAFDRYDRVSIQMRTFTYRFDWGELPKEVERKLRMAEAKIREEDLDRTNQARAKALALQKEKTQMQEQALAQKVNQILYRAAQAYNRHDFSRAQTLAWDAYEMDRRREDARSMYLRARRAGHVQFEDYIREERAERLARVNEEMHQTLIPQVDVLLYPEDWFKKSLRKPTELGDDTEEPWVQVLRDRLDEVVTVNFEDTPLEDAIAFLRNQTGVNFIIANEIFESDPPPITLRATNMKLRTALKWILEVTDLKMAIRDEAIFISTEDVRGDILLRMYDISDLTSPVRDFPGLELAYNAAGTSGGGASLFADAGFDDDEGGIDPEEIADFIQESVAIDSWDEDGVGITTRAGGTLFVSQTSEVHDLIGQLLVSLRNQQSLQVHLQIRLLDVTKGFFEEIGVDWTIANDNRSAEFLGSSDNNLPPRRTTNGFDPQLTGLFYTHDLNYDGSFDLPQVNALLIAAESENDSQILEAPEITCFNGQRANATFVNQFAYIFDYDVQTGSGGNGTLDPQIRILNFGTLLDVRPVVSSDRKYITMEVRPSSAILLRTDIAQLVALTTVANFGVSLFLPIELPVIEIRTMRSTVMLPDKGTLAIGGFTNAVRQRSHAGIPFLAHIPFLGRLFGRNGVYDDNRRLYYLLTAEIIDLAERESLN